MLRVIDRLRERGSGRDEYKREHKRAHGGRNPKP
jgi:hypothetical protein